MSNTFTVTKKDGKPAEIPIWSPEELKANCSKESKITSEVNQHLKALGVPPPYLIHITPEEREKAFLKAYEAHGVPLNGQIKAPAKAPAAEPEAPKAEPVATKPAAAAPAATGELAARVQRVRNTEPKSEGTAGSSSDVLKLLMELKKDITEMKAGIEALYTANTTREEHDDLRNKAIIQTYDVVRETLKFVFETHFIARVTGPTSSGLTPDDILECSEYQGKFMGDVPDLADLALEGLYPKKDDSGND